MKIALIIFGIFISLYVMRFFQLQKRKNLIISIDENNCIGCWRCVKRCNQKVLEIVKDETGTRAVVKNPIKCNACGDCLSKCKFNALKLIKKGNLYSNTTLTD